MKKSRILGYALTLAATLFVGSAMGQDVKGGASFVKTGVDGAATEKKALVTEGKSAGLYVMPDVQFHPGYVTPGYVLTTGFTWNWTAVAAVTVTKPALSPANFVELSAAVGAYDINVKETAPAAFGGCADAVGKNFRLVVFAKPTFAFDAATGRDLTAACGNITAYDAKFNVNASDYVNAKFQLEEHPVTVNAVSGLPVVGATRSTVDVATGNLVAGAVAGAAVQGFKFALSGTAFAFDTDEANRALVITATRDYSVTTGDVVTLYRLVMDNTTATPAYGVNDFISRKSDHNTQTAVAPAAYTFYGDAAKTTLDIYVKRAPVTGPVYHINNNIAK